MEKHGKNLVMESHGKWAKKNSHGNSKRSTAYIEARMRNSDNSISIGYCSVLAMADFQFMFYIPNRNVRQEQSLFSVSI